MIVVFNLNCWLSCSFALMSFVINKPFQCVPYKHLN
jgi:hypothetical protein